VAAALDGDPSGLAGRSGVAEAVPAVVAGVDVSKTAVALAAGAHRGGWYAVASAADLPVPTGSVDVALDLFGPVMADELARVVRHGGAVIAVHPGPDHLGALRHLVYADARPHDVKDPLRGSGESFVPAGSARVTFPVVIGDGDGALDLFAMTPYRWHAPPDIGDRLAAEAAEAGGFRTQADVVVSSYRRR
jgi:23S rRNA (guanine745-N1)-methyltransferase